MTEAVYMQEAAMISPTRIALVFAVVLALAGGAAPTAPANASRHDVSPAISYVSGSLWCAFRPMTVVSHASGTVYHRIDGATVGVYHNGSTFQHDSSTAMVGSGVSHWEVESVGGSIFKANARCE